MTTRKTPLQSGLYPVTDTALLQHNLQNCVRSTLEGGAKMIQYRDKSKDQSQRHLTASKLKQLCDEFNALLIINDDVQLCIDSKADGVHLGSEDQGLAEARHLLGSDKIIGISCYNQLDLAITAEKQGADYVAFGSFYSSSVKPDAVTASLELLRAARLQLSIPIVAIGGITLDNAQALVANGADILAVINGVFAQKAIQSTAQAFNSLYARESIT